MEVRVHIGSPHRPCYLHCPFQSMINNGMSNWGISAADESQDAPVVTGRILALRARVQCGTIERRWNRFEGSIANVTADVPNFDCQRHEKRRKLDEERP